MEGIGKFRIYSNKSKKQKGGSSMTDRTEGRILEIRRRTKQKRKRRENRILSALTLCSIFLVTNLCLICGELKGPGISSVNGISSTVLLRDGTSTYVVTAIAAFCLGVTITALCIRYKNRQKNGKKDTDGQDDIV